MQKLIIPNKKQITYILEELNKPPEEEECDENFDEDINAKDEDENKNNYNDYSEGESINGNSLEEHYKILGNFIIKNNELNK